MSLAHTLQITFGIFGNAATLFLFLVPTITFKRIIKNKSTEQFSGIPYVMTLLNCLLSAWYGLPFVTSDNYLVATINGSGAAIEFIYVLVFLTFAPNKEKGKILAVLLIVLFFFAAVALVSILVFHGRSRKLFCGTAAAVFSIVMYGSPMSVIRLVIRTKSVEYMPFFLSFSVVVSCGCWLTYAMLKRDPFIGISTAVGLVLGIVQLILYAIYCDKKVVTKKTTDEPLEDMGNGTHSNNYVKYQHDDEKQSSVHNHEQV